MAIKGYSAEENAAYRQKKQEEMEELFKRIDEGVRSVFTSEKYVEYLKFSAKFTDYSANNTMLINRARPDASFVAAYGKWRQLGRQVKKGEAGIPILAPVRYKTNQYQEYERPAKDEFGNQIYNEDGTEKMETVSENVTGIAFKKAYVFDVSQTEGKPIPSPVEELKGDIDSAKMEAIFKALRKVTGINIEFEDIRGSAKGYYNPDSKRIAVKTGMSDTQTVKTVFHETAHCLLHDPDKKIVTAKAPRNEKEVQAESTAFIVAEHFGIDTSDYSFPYIATWTKGKTFEQLQKVLQEIQTAAKTIISGVESELLKMQKRELSVEDIIADDELNNIQKAELIIEHGIDDGLVYDATEIDAIKAFAADHEDFEETVKLITDTEAIINQRMNYGYDFSYMTPLGSKEAALDAFDRGEAVYLLYPDNSEGMALERYEIENFDGFFGIEKEENQNRTKANTEGLTTVSKAVALEMWDKDLDVYINGEVALSRDEIEAAGRSDSFAVPDYQYAAQLEFDAPVSENNTKKEEKMPNYQQPYAAKPKNPNILGNTPYEALGSKNDLQYYPNLKNRHADNIAKQLEADGVRFSGVRKGFTTTLTINKRDIPRYEAAVTKVKAMYSQLNSRTESSAPYQRQPVGYSAPAPQYDAPARPQQGRFVSDNPDIIGNTDYRALGKRSELAYYSLNPRHAENVAKQLDADGVPFSGLKGSDDTTITIRKTDIPRYEAAVEKVKAMYDQQKGQRARPAQSEQRYEAPPVAEDYGYPDPPPQPEYSAPPPSYEEYGAPPPEYAPPEYEHEAPAAVHSAPEKPKNPNVIGNTPYEQLGDRSELQYYPKLKNRHAENVAKQLDADGIRFSGLKSGSTTTITINKADIPRYEAAVAKVKAGYEQAKAEQKASSPAAKEAAKPVIPETRPEAPATFKDVPICTMSYMAAKQSSREQEWRNSLRASKACIKYINENLSARYAAHDIGSVVKDLEEQFGLKRALYTIAATIQLKDQDGRFSQAVKDKAREYPFDSDRARLEFLTEAHPVMVCFLYEKLMDREKELQMPAPEIEEPKLSALFEDKFLLPMEQVEIRDDYRGIPETKYYNTSANEYFVEGMGWLDNAEYDAAQRESGERPQDFYKKVTSVNVTYVTTTGEVGEMDISPEEYRLFQDATYSEQKKQAYEVAKAALDERKRENNIEPLPTEMYSVSQTVTRKYEIEALCANGQVATVKSGIASIPEAKKALMEIFNKRKGKARCEFIHPQVLWNKSRPMQWDSPEHAPDVEYMIKQTKGSKPAHSHYLQRLVKDETGAYQNDKVVLRGSFGECNAALAELLKNPPAEDQRKSVTFEIYQLRDDLPERRDISFEPYANLEQRGITPEIGMYQKMYVASSDILPAHGAGMGQFLEAVYQKFNIERPEDFKGHSLSISDVVVVGDDAYYVDKSGFKPLHEFMTGGRDMQRGEVTEQRKPDERREEPQQDKPDAPEKTAEHRKKKSR
ncbi:MAG: DUF3849 domain-containing protein [Ruminiclostridium sp.]|nr:DUF3849 domain-containing protein [Ruminiclostridium sp.]MBP3857601.1 DUF3849 domain-containing protein [Ruminiclostridium sp.]